ncbi:uncharacterized protein PGTG_06571 [Puccinia graminis f. sp. tritici CRL 75-36-700-3]|uniref:NudC domain-containing protein 1 n=1 Tax=Puccinia graminis f. sp. tritici (strain CRL 75-36-700-3 / race SCCL) TaxID=418459 RepID=E3K8K6_PUCGT|nr:uncharacterized protein PGTG_06571 [Puccinia graminis f. sp. tritici CRL 75-36-700-3]EFP80615.1 hypothetical protein PGTG_06571 [Puccinia graminis f. sp. tritici CRL 75-36-700-3]
MTMSTRTEDELCFIPSRDLLNPKFESYKLKEYDQTNLRRIPLAKPIDLSINPNFKSFNFQELKSKSTWNHLLVGSFPNTPAQLIWIEPRSLQISTLNHPDSNDPQISSVLQLPDRREELLGDQINQGIEFDYPTGFALNHHRLNHLASQEQNLWLILDGGKTLFLVDLNLNSSPRILAQKELDDSSDRFIHGFYKIASVDVKDSQSDTFWMILRAKSSQKTSEELDHEEVCHQNIKSTKKRKLLYTPYLVEIRITPNPSCNAEHSSIMPFILDIQLHTQLTGADDLLSVHYDRPGHRWCLRSTSKFTSLSQQTSPQPAQPPEEANERLNQVQSKQTDPKSSSTSSPVSPYAWSQTLSTLTITFNIPFPITSKLIKIDFRTGSINFRLPKLDSLPKENEDYLPNLFAYFGQQFTLNSTEQATGLVLDLWDHVAPEECTWFVESSVNKSTLLTIELEKHTRLRWPQAFKVDFQVSETMDPIELLSITENLAKYTSTADDQEAGLPSKKPKLGLGSAAGANLSSTTPSSSSSGVGAFPSIHNTSLTAGEMDEEIDLANEVMVTGVVMTWLIEKTPDARAEMASPRESDPSDSNLLVKVAQNGIPVELISNPLKVVQLDHSTASSLKKEDIEYESGSTMMIKSDIDGLVFSPPDGREDRLNLRWTHRLSYPALAFVMASKREIWASFFTPQFTLLFETSSASKDRQSLGNLFVYHHTPDRQSVSSQRVIQLSSPHQINPVPLSSSTQIHPHLLGLCALSKAHPSSPSPLSIILLSQHEIIIFDL